jgi:hypothetical protein
MFKIIFIFLLFAFFAPKVHSQIWRYPYEPMGIEPLFRKEYPHKSFSKVLIIDSSASELIITYIEYDKNKQIKKEFETYNGISADTVTHYYYDNRLEKMRVSGKDSIINKYTYSSGGLVTQYDLIGGLNPLKITYVYDSTNRITAVNLNDQIYDRITYDSLGELQTVESYRHPNQMLSDITYYSRVGNVVTYEYCPYDREGKRYNWPCERTIGILNKKEQVEKVTSFDEYGPNNHSSSITYFYYDPFGKIISICDEMDNGNWSGSFYFYDKNDFLKNIQVYNNGDLIRNYRYLDLSK